MTLNTRDDFGALLASRGLLGVAVEVGVAEGRNALMMLEGWGVQKLYLVDLWHHVDGMHAELGWSEERQEGMYQSCMSLLSEHKDKLEVLRGWSVEMAKKVPDESVDFIHIDSTHHYEWVMKDLEAWYPKLVHGGIMSGHDYLSPSFPTVKPAVDEFAEARGVSVHAVDVKRPEHSCFWFEKP